MSVLQFNPYLLDHIPPCPGKDDWSHRVFLTTNEDGQERTLSILEKTPLHGDTMIGVSGFFILNAAAIRGRTSSGRIENIILFDRSVRVEHFWERMQAIITGSEHRGEVFEKVAALLDNEKHWYYNRTEPLSKGEEDPRYAHQTYIQELRAEMEMGQSWLSSDEKFARIKAIFVQGRFIFKRADLTDVEAFRSIGLALKAEGLQVDTVYLSNTFEYLKSGKLEADFGESVEQLVAVNTLLVQTQWPRIRLSDPLEQVVYIRSGPNPEDYSPVPLPQRHLPGAQPASPNPPKKKFFLLRKSSSKKPAVQMPNASNPPQGLRQKLSALFGRHTSSNGAIFVRT